MKSFRVCNIALFRSARPLGWKLAVSVLVGLVEIACSLAFVWLSKRVVDIATGAVDGNLMAGVWHLLSVMALQVAFRVGFRYWEGLVVVDAFNTRRAAAFSKVMRSSWNGQEKYHTGDSVNRLEEDVRVTTDFVCESIPDILITLVQLVAATAYVFFLQPRLAWILVVIMPVAVAGSRLFFKKLRRLTTEIRTEEGRIESHIQENLQHRVLIKTLIGTASVLEKLGSMQKEVRDKTVTRLNYNAVSRGFMQLGFAGGYALVFLWGVFGLRDGTVTYGMMVAFLQLVGQVQRPVANLAFQIPAYIRALSSEERLLDLVELPQEDESEPVVLPGAPGVRVEGVSFSYENSGKKVLEGFSHDFKPGTMTTVVGATGTGKSTLIRIILSLLQPQDGRVTLYGDGREVEASPATRANFMYVPQGNSLMSGSLRENLLMARPDATEEELRDVLHIAAADFVLDLPGGLDTTCAEVGAGLSEGQAQRIAIARALLRPGGVLILDESTSALDSDTEQALLERIFARCHGTKTIICITHKTASGAFSDDVLDVSAARQNPSERQV